MKINSFNNCQNNHIRIEGGDQDGSFKIKAIAVTSLHDSNVASEQNKILAHEAAHVVQESAGKQIHFNHAPKSPIVPFGFSINAFNGSFNFSATPSKP